MEDELDDIVPAKGDDKNNGDDSGKGATGTPPAGKGKSKPLVGTLLTHNAAIIAVILIIGSMIGNHFQELRDDANTTKTEIEDERQAMQTRLVEDSTKIEEYQLEEQSDSSANEYSALIKSFSDRVDSAQVQEKVLSDKEDAADKTFRQVDAQNKRSNFADALFQISILLSSIGLTNKSKFLTYSASGLTVVGVVMYLSMVVL